MSDVTQILRRIEQGDPAAAERLLPLVYDELRKLAALKMTQESPGQTLQATALVHEAYLRLVDVDQPQHWDGRGHFSDKAELQRLGGRFLDLWGVPATANPQRLRELKPPLSKVNGKPLEEFLQ